MIKYGFTRIFIVYKTMLHMWCQIKGCLTFSLLVNIILPTMPQGGPERTTGIAPERRFLPDGNVAIIRRHTNNAHRLYFSVEIGRITQYPFPRGSSPEEARLRAKSLKKAQAAMALGEITDEFVVGRKENTPLLIGIKPVDPERRVLTVEAPKNADGKLGKVTLRLPLEGFPSIKLNPSFLAILEDFKEGTILNKGASAFFYFLQQGRGQFVPEPTAPPAS